MSKVEHELNTASEELERLLHALDDIKGREIARAIDRLVRARIAQALEEKPSA
jgi:hypothetical protein